jgi:hypothetical protein
MAQQAPDLNKLSANKQKLNEAIGRQRTAYGNLYVGWVSIADVILFARCS